MIRLRCDHAARRLRKNGRARLALLPSEGIERLEVGLRHGEVYANPFWPVVRDFHDERQRLGIVEVKPAPGPGQFILIGLGVVAAAAIAYAAWQTFRPDDDLWVEDDLDDDLEPQAGDAATADI